MTPKVICHIMSSVDGRLLPSRWTAPYGCGMVDCVKEYSAIGGELGTDAWMFGLTTAQEGLFPYKFTGRNKSYTMPKTPYHAPRTTERLFIVTDAEGKIYYNTNKARGCDVVAILGENVSDEYLRHLQDAGVSYVIGGVDGNNLEKALTTLADDFGVKVISLQGGGVIDGSMLASGLIDELSLVIYPGIDGKSGIPSIFEYIGEKTNPAEGQSLELLSVEKRPNGVVWLRYKFHNV